MGLENTLVTAKTMLALNKLGYVFGKHSQLYVSYNNHILAEPRTKELLAQMIDKGGLCLCTIFDAQMWLREHFNFSVEPLFKAKRKDSNAVYEINIINTEIGSIEDFFTVEGDYNKAMQAGLERLTTYCCHLNK